MTDPTPVPHPHLHHEGKWKTVALVLLPIVGILLVIVAIYLVRPRDPGVVTVVYTDGQPGAADINIGTVIDATDPAVSLSARLGYRYKVFVEDESEDRTSGIAKIGGMITFIPGARRGQTVLADVTRVRPRVVDAILVRVLSEITMPALPPPAAAYEPPPGDPTAHVVAGAELDVVISEASSQNPETEGIARIRGLVVVVTGAPAMGERVNVRITDRRERIAFAELTGQPAGTAPDAAPRQSTAPAYSSKPGDRAGHVVRGAELDVVISEVSGRNPQGEGVARVQGLVVFVEGATTIGESVHVRITDRRERAATAVLTGQPAGTSPAPPAGDIVRRALPPGATRSTADHVVAGAELEVVIVEPSRQNPETEGVAKVDGLIVFVAGATTIGETVQVRITARRERVAFAEVLQP